MLNKQANYILRSIKRKRKQLIVRERFEKIVAVLGIFKIISPSFASGSLSSQCIAFIEKKPSFVTEELLMSM